jgi:hypothetical protein
MSTSKASWGLLGADCTRAVGDPLKGRDTVPPSMRMLRTGSRTLGFPNQDSLGHSTVTVEVTDLDNEPLNLLTLEELGFADVGRQGPVFLLDLGLCAEPDDAMIGGETTIGHYDLDLPPIVLSF